MSSLSWPRFLNIGKGRKAGKEQELVNSFLPNTLMNKLPLSSVAVHSVKTKSLPPEEVVDVLGRKMLPHASLLAPGVTSYTFKL